MRFIILFCLLLFNIAVEAQTVPAKRFIVYDNGSIVGGLENIKFNVSLTGLGADVGTILGYGAFGDADGLPYLRTYADAGSRYSELGWIDNTGVINHRIRSGSTGLFLNSTGSTVINTIEVSQTNMKVTDGRATTIGLTYNADYTADILANARSIPDVGAVAQMIEDSIDNIPAATGGQSVYSLREEAFLSFEDFGEHLPNTDISTGGDFSRKWLHGEGGLGANGVAPRIVQIDTSYRAFWFTAEGDASYYTYIAPEFQLATGNVVTSASWDVEFRYKWKTAPAGSLQSFRAGFHTTSGTDTYNDGWFFLHNSNGTCSLVNNAAVTTSVSGPTLHFDKWYTVRITYDKVTNISELFVDGVSQGTDNATPYGGSVVWWFNWRATGLVADTSPDDGLYLDYIAFKVIY